MNNLEETLSHISDLVEEGFWGQIASELVKFQPADIAEIISHFEFEHQLAMFKDLPEDIQPDVFAELPSEIVTDISNALSSEEVSDLVDEMDPDDAADVLGDLDKAKSSQIMEQMDDDNADEVRMLMTYPEDSAGGIMTTDLITMYDTQTILEALDKIATNEEGEHIFQVYIIDKEEKLVGIVTIWQLLHQRDRNKLLSEIMSTDTFAVRSDVDQEEVAKDMSKYDLSVIPVVDSNGVLLGRITHDDIIEVIQEEAEEDILRLAGSNESDLGNVSSLKSCAIRLPWLAVTLLGGMLTSTLTNLFNAQFSAVIVLAAFIPNIMAMGGNTGLQSSVLLIREIASGSARRHSLARLFMHEVKTGAIMGVICGLGIFLWVVIMMATIPSAASSTTYSPWFLGMVIAISLFSAMSFAAGFGAVIPIFLDRCKIDPAVASGPFISVINDISALIIYYAVAASLILKL